MVGVGVRVMDSVGEFAGWGVLEGVLVCAASSVWATMVAAWSFRDGSEDVPGKLQAESTNNNETSPVRAILFVFIRIPYFGEI